MPISSLNSLTRQVGVTAITEYQKHISPHKGFACAHRVLYGGESCSQYFKRVIAQDGFRSALIKSRERFQACKQANHILQSHAQQPGQEAQNTQSPKKAPDKSAQPACGISSLSSDGTHCVTCADFGCNCAEVVIAPDDCSGFDCSGADCSGVDCSFLDCGSCLP
ncbi:membrane protein insertion efficiency factor YidD [Nostoc sp. CCY0012]|uniref:membrane protein insertion efficiency factor YidD n=1 Tax=Nostoc sp. CCY0012 TaxID=1056123 RepID=UPI0039C688F7